MSLLSSRLSLIFSCIGHSYSHLFASIFYVVALSLEQELAMTHGEVIALIVIGNVLFGVAAPLAGWLGDRWSAIGMMGVFFAGTGAGFITTGLASGTVMITFGLAVTGLFASIYHPVGISWLVKNAENRGTALGINGVFGGLGPAAAAMSAGILIELFGWRAAFLVPGALLLVTALAFYGAIAKGWLVETKTDRRVDVPASKKDTVRAFAVLALTMLCTGLIYQSTQAGLPKAFAIRLADLQDGGVMSISALVALVYLVAGGVQILAGRLADLFPLKIVYLLAYALQVPLLYLAGGLAGTAMVSVAILMVTVNTGALPAENALVARYAPSQWRGLAFGLKFILAFGVSTLGVKMEGVLFDISGDFVWLFTTLAAVAAVGTAATLLLPSDKQSHVPLAKGAV